MSDEDDPRIPIRRALEQGWGQLQDDVTFPSPEADQRVAMHRYELREVANDLEDMGDSPVSASNASWFFLGLAITLLVAIAPVSEATDNAKPWVVPVFLAVALMAIVIAAICFVFDARLRGQRRTERQRLVRKLRSIDARYPGPDE